MSDILLTVRNRRIDVVITSTSHHHISISNFTPS